jgi:hypothetical protein
MPGEMARHVPTSTPHRYQIRWCRIVGLSRRSTPELLDGGVGSNNHLLRNDLLVTTYASCQFARLNEVISQQPLIP